MVLKGGMQVGHGRVPRIPRVGKETQIGNFQLFHKFTLFLQRRHGGRLPVRCVNEHEAEKQEVDGHEATKQRGLSRGHWVNRAPL